MAALMRSTTTNADGRVLHLVHSGADLSEAIAPETGLTAAAPGAQWLLGPVLPDAAFDPPDWVEWIRVPELATEGADWTTTVSRLVEALRPARIVVHRDVHRASPTLAATLHQIYGDRMTIMPMEDLARPLRVGYVLKKFPRYSETFILREVLALERLGVDVHVLSLHLPRDGRFHGSLSELRRSVHYLEDRSAPKALGAVLPLLPEDPGGRRRVTDLFWETLDRGDPRLLGYLARGIEIAALVRERGITHLHAHFATSACEVARVAAAIAGVTYSFTAHAKDIYADDVDRRGLDLKLRDAAFAVTVCDANVDYLRAMHASANGTVRRLFNGIRLDRETDARPAGEHRDGSAPAVDVLAVGRFVEKKGFSMLLDSLAEVRRRGVPFSCRILGDGELFEDVRAHRDRLGLGDVVDLPGSASSEQIRAQMATAGFLVCPSIVAGNGDQDALPTVLLEAMAAGLATIGTRVGGIGEILNGGRAGRLIDPDPAALTDAICELLTRPERRAHFASEGRAHAAENFDVDRNVARLAEWFRGAGTTVPSAVQEARSS